MGYYAIGLLILAAGVLGAAHWAATRFGVPEEAPTSQSVEVEQADAEEPETADPGKHAALDTSSARRMDDFGPGPSGVTVTVPLRDRHRQAFSGGSRTSGGRAGSEAGAGDREAPYRVIERAPEEGTTPAPEDAGQAPSFDVVRVDPTGRTVLAGRAAPLSEVEIKAGDEVIDRVTATATGEWVSTPVDPLSAGDQELSLRAASGDEEPVESRQIVVVAVPEADPAEPAAEQPVAVIMDKDQGGEGRVLQAPDKLQSDDGDGSLALKLVDYDDEGAIKLSGEAPPGVPVRIYVDNEPAALVIGDSKGYWITTLDQELPGGDYMLRLDQLDIKGQTVARLETPLTRVVSPPVEGEAKVDYVVVQPGNSLWRIARRLSGDGFNYVYIFEANQAQIRDPDIIYPGQVFEVPPGPG